MHMSRRVFATLALAAVACSPEDQLTVQNPNNPETARTLARPADVESFIAGSFATWYDASMGGSNDGVQNQMAVMAMENGSSLANFAMGPRGALPRSPALNARQNFASTQNLKEYNALSRSAASAALGIARLDAGVNLGTTAQNQRARSFGFFVMGLSLGYLSLVYDSAAVTNPQTAALLLAGSPAAIDLVGRDTVLARSMAYMDSAITWATDPTTAAAFPLPANWIPSNALTSTQYVQLIRSFKAKIRAQWARNPTERAAVNWALVLADAQAGITSDFILTTNTTTLFSPAWPVQHYIYGTWHQMPYSMIGMADTSGGYAAWIGGAPLGGRGIGTPSIPFAIQTRDLRFPQPAFSAAQPTGGSVRDQLTRGSAPLTGGVAGCSFPATAVAGAPPTCTAANQIPLAVAGVAGGRPYFRMRPSGEDPSAAGFFDSQYDYYRFRAWFNPPSNRNGAFPLMVRAEVLGLVAEAAIRTGNFPAATAAIDLTRVPNGLPSVAGIADLVTPVPGGIQGCIPRVPTGATGPVVCGNLLEAMKYEKRLETAFTTFGGWFFDSRGWGDLPQGTSVQWAVPWQELDARVKTPYDRPFTELAGPSAYGW